MKKRIIISIVLAIALVFPVVADNIAMPSLFIPTVDTNGFGGHHVAFTDNVFSLLVNPGAMIQTQQSSVFTVSGSLFNPQFTFGLISPIMDLFGGDSSAFGKIADTLSAQNGNLSLGLGLNELPLSIAWVANGFGFGVWNRTYVNVNVTGTNVSTEMYEDVMVPVGVAFQILSLGSHTLDAGLTIKPFARAWINEDAVITDLISNPGDFTDNLRVPLIVGGTLDLGLMYRWDDLGLSAGFTVNNIYSNGQVVYNIFPTDAENNSYYIPMTMNLGLAYELQLGRLLDLAVAADWHNIANLFKQKDYLNSRNFLLDFGVGAQLTLFNMFYFRVGLNEMLPAAGVGVKLGAFNIDVAYYGKEIGYEPGLRSAAVLEFSISIRPEAKKKVWPWAQKAIIGGN